MIKRLIQSAYGIFMLVGAVLCTLFAPANVVAAPYAAMVMDARSGEVLHSENADSRLHPASLTKMMTLYIAFEAIRLGEISLDSTVTISRNAAAEPPSKLGLRAGQRIQLRYLIRAAAVKSANDAATAIGEAIEGSEAAFARRMNRTALALGMTRTTFKNAHGLTESGHLSTARDMSILGRHIFYDYPQYYNIFSRRSTNAGVKEVANTNRRFLDAYEGSDGIKTGYTRAAGFNLVASAQRRRERIIATVFGGNSTADRNAKVAALLDMGFSRAPSRVAVNKPRLPNYKDLPSTPNAEIVVALADGSISGGPAGRIVRKNTAPAKSIRPRPRAGANASPDLSEELLAAIQSEVASTFATSGEAAAEVSETGSDDTLAAATTAAAVQAVLDSANLEDTNETADVAKPDIDTQQDETLIQVAQANDPKPRPRPDEISTLPDAGGMAPDTPTALAAKAGPETAPGVDVEAVDSLVADATSIPAAGVENTPGQVDQVQLVEIAPLEEAPVTSDVAALPNAPVAYDVTLAAPEAEPVVMPSHAGGLDPLPNADELVLTARTDMPAPKPEPTIRTEPEHTEIVTRMSTSGGRHSGISLGKYGTRDQAERTLITVALSDMSSFDGALRRIVKRSSGFEANFMGLSAEQAQQACRRISSRGRDCEVIGG